jgi:hypothetical protein
MLDHGSSIHSSGQLEWFQNRVGDRSVKVGGEQRILTNDGYIHSIDFEDGLAYIHMRPYTDEEWDSLPHVVWTSDSTWDPRILNHNRPRPFLVMISTTPSRTILT